MKTQPQRQSSGRHFGTHSIVKFERQRSTSARATIARKLRRFLANLFPVTVEPRVRETVTATGDRRWIVYDANQGYKLEFDSEQAVLEWLDAPPPPKTRFERIWN
ncbi:hypothetical protein H6F67_11200 [Microcoleus sp. FACHB-1515]|uniref:hypothetical protein n=1 Tax=Cyanophyceae TaxID=3028117 RepID=UPI001688441B|nr:hypothetical protein [Microcoleus sp. FACHB-1515]MBD2090421.1 hypothetical protein [Microcoleus sp. FACHB-1515]